MPLQSVVEIALCLTRFKNVDLHTHGIYRVSVSAAKGHTHSNPLAIAKKSAQRAAEKLRTPALLVPHFSAPASDRATPYSCFEGRPGVSRVEYFVVEDSLRYYQPARIDGQNDVYYSSAVQVRYVDEERNLNDGVQFRIELDTLEEREGALSLCLCLERADTEAARDAVNGAAIEFTLLCERRVNISYSTEGVHSYFPVIFDNAEKLGFALLEATLHVSVTNVRFNPDTGIKSASTANSLEAFILELFQSENQGSSEAGHPPNLHGPIDASSALGQFLETLRNVCLFSLRSSHSALNNMIRKVNEAAKADEVASAQPAPQLDEIAAGSLPAHLLTASSPLDLARFASALGTELDEFSSTLLLGWHAFTAALRKQARPVLNELKSEWFVRAAERAGECIIRERLGPEDLAKPTPRSKKSERAITAARIRESILNIRKFQREHVEDPQLFDDPTSYPIMFEQSYERPAEGSEQELIASQPGGAVDEADVRLAEAESEQVVESSSRRAGDKTHDFVVLIHGFLGSSWDLRTFRNYLSILHPKVVAMLSAANENDTDSDIEVLGFRLAHEISDFIGVHLSNHGGKLGRLSFVCHSIGGVILRSALTQDVMRKFDPHLHALISLSSPHLGSKSMLSPVIKYGMWAMRHWRKAMALTQLSMSDATDPRECLLYKLSESDKGLALFDRIFLVASHQDQYIPYHSARIEPFQPERATQAEADLAATMSANIWRGVRPAQVTRIDLAFEFDDVVTRKIDKLLGRAAHIKVLDSPAMALSFLLQYGSELFVCE